MIWNDDGRPNEATIEEEADPVLAWTLLALWSLFCIWYAWPLG